MLVHKFENQLGSYAMNKLLSLQILIFTRVWDVWTPWLVDLMNPKTYAEENDCDTAILFPFSIVSAYANLFVTDFFILKDGEDPATTVREMVYQVIWPVALGEAFLMLLPYIQYRSSHWREDRAMAKEGTTVKKSSVEKHAKRLHFGSSDLNRDMKGMVINLGYILIFGSLAPEVGIVILGAFVAKIHIDAVKLCLVYQRVMPLYVAREGIGQWNFVLRLLTMLSTWSTLDLPIYNLEYLQDWTFQKKLILLLLSRLVIEIVTALANYLIPDVCGEALLIRAKRARVTTRMNHQLVLSERLSICDSTMGSDVCTVPTEIRKARTRALLDDVDPETDDHFFLYTTDSGHTPALSHRFRARLESDDRTLLTALFS